MRFWTARSAVYPTARALSTLWAPIVSTFYTPHDRISLHGLLATTSELTRLRLLLEATWHEK